MKEPSPPYIPSPQHSNTTNLLNRDFPGVTTVNLFSHVHVIDKYCYGDFCYFFLLASAPCDGAGQALNNGTLFKMVQFT